MQDKCNDDIDYSCVDNIFKCQTIDEIKTAINKFISTTNEVREIYNGMLVWELYQYFEKLFKEWSLRYSVSEKSSEWNAVIVPPEHSPIMLLPSPGFDTYRKKERKN